MEVQDSIIEDPAFYHTFAGYSAGIGLQEHHARCGAADNLNSRRNIEATGSDLRATRSLRKRSARRLFIDEGLSLCQDSSLLCGTPVT